MYINVVLPNEFVVPVRFASFTYNVSEGVSTDVTVRTIGAHDFAFTVFLIIKDGECQSVMDSITVHSMLPSCCVSCCSKESTLLAKVFQLHNLSQFRHSSILQVETILKIPT